MAALAVASCGRRTEFIGALFDGSAPASVVDRPRAGDGSVEAGAAVCTPDPPVAVVASTDWNCGAAGERCFRDPSVPADAPFGGAADPAAQPVIVYPLAGSVHPVNLPDLTVQWRRGPGAGQTAFRIRVVALAYPARRYDFLAPCTPPPAIPTPPAEAECAYTLPRRAWAAVASENAGQGVEIAVEARDGGRGTVTPSAPVRIAFSPAPIGGGAYFFSDPARGTFRGQLGGGLAQPFISPGTPANRFGCGGCHALSRDGRTIAFAAEQIGYLTIARADNPGQPLVAPPEPPQPNASTMAVSPDGALVLVSHGSGGNDGLLVALDAATGREVARLDPAVLQTPERKVYFPDWSPDGTEIVATVSTQSETPWSVNNGGLAVFPWAGGAFGRATVIVPRDGALIHAYPSWSPDGRWIAFTSAPIPGRSYRNPQSRLRLVSRAGGTVYELNNATQQGGKGSGSSWPRFVPFSQAGCQLFFITLHTSIDYGYWLKNSIDPNGGWSQLWLSAIDVRKLPADPSSAPIWLPFQNPRTHNALATWVQHLACGPQSPCGDGTTCSGGECVPDPI